MDKIAILKDCVDKISKDAYKFFEKNNKAAGVRARKKLQKCKKYAQEIRNLIQKSKHEHVQKRAAVLANTAALSTDKFIRDNHVTFNKIKKQDVSLKTEKDSCHVFKKENDLNMNFLEENLKNFDFSQSRVRIQGYNRIEKLPSFSGDNIEILR